MNTKFSCEFRYPPAKGPPPGSAKVAFRWTTPEVSGPDAAREAARERAIKAGYAVRSINFRADRGKTTTALVVYVVKGE